MIAVNEFIAKVLLLTCAICISATVALPTGAPKSACHDMIPRHGKNIAVIGALAPYRLNVSLSQIDSGQVITISLRGLSASDKFRGFFIEVRKLEENGNIGDDPIGEFTVPVASNGIARIVDCGDNMGVIMIVLYLICCFMLYFIIPQNGVTHRNAANELSIIEVQWMIAGPYSGDVIVRATVVRDFQHFWTDLRSEKITIRGQRQS